MCGTCAHVGGDQDSFLGLAVMQVCGDQVLPGARNDGDWVVILPDALTTMMEQICGDQLVPRVTTVGACIFFATVTVK